ncbi:MAG: hypothetical protein EOM59_06620 [Clostridia bacterium]|nr:hypothetical protein [Clostridia bacterium]
MNVVLNRSSDQDQRVFNEALCPAGLSEEEQLRLHFKKDMRAVLKSRMTTRDLLRAITGLMEITTDLAEQLATASRTAATEEPQSCSGKCDYEESCELSIPPCILAEAGIPLDKPLLAYVEDGSIVIKGEEEPFPTKVTGALLRFLADEKVDAEGLSDLLKGEKIVNGE